MTQIDVEMLEHVTGGRVNVKAILDSRLFRWTGYIGGGSYAVDRGTKAYNQYTQPSIDDEQKKK